MPHVMTKCLGQTAERNGEQSKEQKILSISISVFSVSMNKHKLLFEMWSNLFTLQVLGSF